MSILVDKNTRVIMQGLVVGMQGLLGPVRGQAAVEPDHAKGYLIYT